MTSTRALEELEALRARIAAKLLAEWRDPAAPIQVRSIAVLAGGACQDNWRVELAVPPSATGVGSVEMLVLRSDAERSLTGSLDRHDEFDVMSAAAAAGVKTPFPRWRMQHLVRDDAWSYFIPFLPGDSIGRHIVNAPEDARHALVIELAQEAAKIHAITPATHPALLREPVRTADTRSPQDQALASLRADLDKRTIKRPATELALDWLAKNRPPESDVPTTLVHGDYRVGNFLVAPEGLTGVLDWEFAHWGSPDEDLAWLCLRDWRFGKLSLPVGGIGTRAPFLRAYAEASGRIPNPASLRWWEIYGNCRWAVGTEEQAERYTRHGHGTAEIELAAIGRRGAEMDWEALRLIELAMPTEPKRESTIPPSVRDVRDVRTGRSSELL